MFFPRLHLHQADPRFLGANANASAAGPTPGVQPSAASVAAVHRFLNPAGLYDPAPNDYSHVAMAEGAVRQVHVAGQGGEHADGSLPPDFDAQVAQAMGNLQTALAAAGAGPEHVLKLTLLIVDHSEARLATVSSAVRALWGALPAPACTLIPVPRLALDGMLFEIDATAAVPLAAPAPSPAPLAPGFDGLAS
ncbi:MAG: RidA family protein [Comamonadaceae bacterium]|nr:MAG: RidA family protein [Comamonadaceae bacterium]